MGKVNIKPCHFKRGEVIGTDPLKLIAVYVTDNCSAFLAKYDPKEPKYEHYLSRVENLIVKELDNSSSFPESIMINSKTADELLTYGKFVTNDSIQDKKTGLYRHGLKLFHLKIFVTDSHIIDDQVIVF